MTMYDLNLTTSHFPAQNDAEIRDITVGGLLREVAASHPDAVAMMDVAESRIFDFEKDSVLLKNRTRNFSDFAFSISSCIERFFQLWFQ